MISKIIKITPLPLAKTELLFRISHCMFPQVGWGSSSHGRKAARRLKQVETAQKGRYPSTSIDLKNKFPQELLSMIRVKHQPPSKFLNHLAGLRRASVTTNDRREIHCLSYPIHHAKACQ